jgi:hypothetical protein
MYVTRHSRVSAQLGERLWHLYESSYQKTAEAAVTREMYFREEFDAVVSDITNRVWILWKDEQPFGMMVLATDVGATRYLSRSYLEARYPEKLHAGLVRYILFAVIDRSSGGFSAPVKLAVTAFALEAQEGALVIFDSPAKNHGERGNMAELVRRVARLAGESVLEEIEVQRYYALTFAGPKVASGATTEEAAVESDEDVTV